MDGPIEISSWWRLHLDIVQNPRWTWWTDGTPGSSLIDARYFYSFQFADLCLEALYWALYEKADNDIQSIVETIAGNVRVVRLREEPAKRRPALAWIPSLLRWGLGRQVSERFIFLLLSFLWFDHFDHLQALRRLDPPVEAVDEVRKDVEFSVHCHRGSVWAQSQPGGWHQQEK